jgi:hypothetical protein
LIAEITTFMPTLLEMFGLPSTLNPNETGRAR